MRSNFDTKRTVLFFVFAFGIAWAIDLAIYLTGGLLHSHLLVARTGWTLAQCLMLLTMAAPALAHILTRVITREGWRDVFLRPHFKPSWRYWLLAWVGTPVLILLGLAIFFLIFPNYFDPTLAAARQILDQAIKMNGRSASVSPAMFIVIQIMQAILIAPLINGLATLGEEFGWRAYLLPKLLPLGARKTMLILGIIWGVWHWPLILMGYEYGQNYPGAPWLGPLVFVWFTFMFGTFLAWLTLKARSVWPAVIGHASMNAIGPIGVLMTRGQPNPLLGPLPNGLLGFIPFTILVLWLLWRSRVFSQKDAVVRPSGVQSI
jgi:membrane protease YdiL (CAAX protease family)